MRLSGWYHYIVVRGRFLGVRGALHGECHRVLGGWHDALHFYASLAVTHCWSHVMTWEECVSGTKKAKSLTSQALQLT